MGQHHISRTLQNAIRLDRIAHAYLFTGARGVGKTSVARILSKALNCSHGPGPSPCNKCSNCTEITNGNSVDVIEIDGASNRGIDSIRELRETVRYRPAKSRYKIYIIDEVHMLTTEAFNALLKTLEEPPEHVIFIFATTEPHKIPSTILSRCQCFDFRRIPTADLVKHLGRIAGDEGAKVSESVLYAVAREADGSMRDGQSLLEQVLAFSGDGLSDEDVLDVLGIVDRRSVYRVGEAIQDGDLLSCLEVVSDLYHRGIDSRRFAQSLCEYFRNLLLLSLGGHRIESLVDLPAEERELLKKVAQRTTTDTIFLYFQMVLKGEEDIRRSTLPRAVLEMLLLRMAQLPRLDSLPGIVEKLSAIEDQIGKAAAHFLSERKQPYTAGANQTPEWFPSQPDQKGRRYEDVPLGRERHGPGDGIHPSGEGSPYREPSVRVAKEVRDELSPEASGKHAPAPFSDENGEMASSISPAVQESKLGSRGSAAGVDEVIAEWLGFLEWLMNRDPILGAKLNGSSVQAGDEGDLMVEVSELFAEKLNDAQSLEKLSSAAAEFFGLKCPWVVRARSSVKEPVKESKTKVSKVNPKRAVVEHPMVLQALEMLGGEIVEVKATRPQRASKKI